MPLGEARIIDLAADGATNPQIAQAPFVTTKTVETHLANAYRKLGINSRRAPWPTSARTNRKDPPAELLVERLRRWARSADERPTGNIEIR